MQPNVIDLWYIQTMNIIRSNSVKYQRFTASGFKDIGIRKFEFVAKAQFLYPRNFANAFVICNLTVFEKCPKHFQGYISFNKANYKILNF